MYANLACTITIMSEPPRFVKSCYDAAVSAGPDNSGWITLPDGILYDIFQYLLPECRTIRQVCKPFCVLFDRQVQKLQIVSNEPFNLEDLNERFPSLESLKLLGTWVTDDKLANLGSLTSLTSLILDSCKDITDTELVHIGALSALTRLHLTDCYITDACLAHLLPCKNLTYLDLTRCYGITGDGFCHLSLLTSLASLFLKECSLVDACLAHLLPCKNLTDLDLSWCFGITDAALTHLGISPPSCAAS